MWWTQSPTPRQVALQAALVLDIAALSNVGQDGIGKRGLELTYVDGLVD